MCVDMNTFSASLNSLQALHFLNWYEENSHTTLALEQHIAFKE